MWMLALAAALADEPATIDVVTLSDGQTLTGDVLSASDADGVTLRLSDGRELRLPADVVKEVSTREVAPGTTGTWGLDPNRGRYLYSPSAFPLGGGNGTFAQRALAISSLGVGVVDGVDVELGTVLPVLFTGTPVGVVGVKGAARLTDGFRMGVGAQGFVVSDAFAGFAFVNATIGEPDFHGTVNAGVALDFASGQVEAGVATFSASRRLGPKVSWVTENWLFYFTNGEGPWGGPVFFVPSGGVRLFGPSFAVDLAVVPVVTGQSDVPIVPAPWVSFAWAFRLGKS
jgi:hypothetical protein